MQGSLNSAAGGEQGWARASSDEDEGGWAGSESSMEADEPAPTTTGEGDIAEVTEEEVAQAGDAMYDEEGDEAEPLEQQQQEIDVEAAQELVLPTPPRDVAVLKSELFVKPVASRPTSDEGDLMDESSAASSHSVDQMSIDDSGTASESDVIIEEPSLSDVDDEPPAKAAALPFQYTSRLSRAARDASPSNADKAYRRVPPLDISSLAPDTPLPDPLFDFHISNYAPAPEPGLPPARPPLQTMTTDERIAQKRRDDETARRIEQQQKLMEDAFGTQRWEWEWRTVEGKGKGKGKAVEQGADESKSTCHDAVFFPFAHHSGLAYMEGVLAVCGGDKIELLHVPAASTSTSAPLFTPLASASSPLGVYSSSGETYRTLAWSVNITTRPYTPMLAVGGTGRVVQVYLVLRKTSGEWVLHLDRTITGHGGTIHHLRFHPTHPHLLASCSEDRTIRFVDPTLPWGTNAAVAARVERSHSGKPDKRKAKQTEELLRRPRVLGEVLAIVSEGGHRQGVLSCDFHETQDVLVSSGMDGFIHLWQLPPSLVAATPAFPSDPSSPVYRHPPPPTKLPQPPLLPFPRFSTLGVHPGQWPSTLRFASPVSGLVLSSAPVSHPEGRFSPRHSVKLWVPAVLDCAPNAVFDAREAAKARGELEEPVFPPPRIDDTLKVRVSNAFRVEWEATLEGQHCIGDGFGWYRPRRPTASESSETNVPEAVLVVPTTAAPGGTDSIAAGDGLYFFRPFAPLPVPPPPASSAKPASSTSAKPASLSSRNRASTSQPSTPSRPSTPLSGAGSFTSPIKLSSLLAPLSLAGAGAPTAPQPSRAAQEKERAALVDVLFPAERDRTAYDFHPRLLPSFVAPLPDLPPMEEDDMYAVYDDEVDTEDEWKKRVRHVRAVAVMPEGGRVVVAVGERGMIEVYRAQKVDEADRGS